MFRIHAPNWRPRFKASTHPAPRSRPVQKAAVRFGSVQLQPRNTASSQRFQFTESRWRQLAAIMLVVQPEPTRNFTRISEATLFISLSFDQANPINSGTGRRHTLYVHFSCLRSETAQRPASTKQSLRRTSPSQYLRAVKDGPAPSSLRALAPPDRTVPVLGQFLVT